MTDALAFRNRATDWTIQVFNGLLAYGICKLTHR